MKPRRYPSNVYVFRLFPEPCSSLFVRVLVFPSAKHMRTYRELSKDAEGCCTDLKVIRYRGKRARALPVFAEVCLHRGRLGTEVITHELFHATMAFGRRIGFDFTRLDADDSINSDEERLTYAHGRLCRQFVNRAHDAGLYDD